MSEKIEDPKNTEEEEENCPNRRIEMLQEYNIDVDAGRIELFAEEVFAYNGILEFGEEPGVEYCMASRFIRNIGLLADIYEVKEKPLEERSPILVEMKTCGGDWSEGMAIYHAIRAATKKCPVTILSYTHARSMSSIILQAATKRVLMPESTFMIHHGQLGMAMQEEETFYSDLDFHRNNYDCRKRMLDIYVNALKHGGSLKDENEDKIRETLLEMMVRKNNVWWTEWGAVEVGFADLVWDDYDEKRLYEYTPEDFARNNNFKPRYK